MTQAFKVGFFFLFGAAITWVLYETLGDGNGIQTAPTYSVKAEFEDLKQLKIGDGVRLSGVRIGQVGSTDLVRGQAVATLIIEKQYYVPANSVAAIATSGLLGNNFVKLTYGTSPQELQNGATIKTREAADLNTLIEEIGSVASSIQGFMGSLEETVGDPGSDAGNLFTNLNMLVVENRGRLGRTLDNFERVSEQLASGKGTLGKLISDEDGYSELLATVKDAANFFNGASNVVSGLSESKGTLGMLLHDEALASDVRTSITEMGTFSKKLGSDDSTLGRLVGDDDLYQQAQATLNKVNTAVDSTNDAGPITAVGVAANALF